MIDIEQIDGFIDFNFQLSVLAKASAEYCRKRKSNLQIYICRCL